MAGRILVADELPTNRIYLHALLRAGLFDVIEARNAAEALELAARHHPDLLILDAQLSGQGFAGLCRNLRRDPVLARIPVLALTATYDAETRLALLGDGANEVLPRPLNEPILRARIRNLRRATALEQEYSERAATAAELGFAETANGFASRQTMWLVEADEAPRPDWIDAMQALPNLAVTRISAYRMLVALDGAANAPDVILLPRDLLADRSGLTAIAELRTRAETRHCGVIMEHAPEDRQAATAALDLGANDLVEADSTPQELALRLRAQLDGKARADSLRLAIETGLQLATTDPLTGLYNRRYALPHLDRIARRSAINGTPFAVLAIDIDRFKAINDSLGHAAGDAVLVEIANRIKGNLRSIDLVARTGGEEFLVVMPDTPLAAARATAERMRRLIAERPVMAGDVETAVTVSIGIAAGGENGVFGDRPQDLVESADQALLAAKTLGRNMVETGRAA